MNRFSEKPAGLFMSSDLKSRKGKFGYWTLFAFVTIVMIFTFVPVIWMVLTAFKSSAEMYQSAAFFPKDMSLNTLIGRVTEAWVKLDLGRSIIQTLILTVGHVFFGIVFPGIAGYILSKHKVAGTKLVFVLVVWTMMMPSIIRTVPQYMSYLSFPFIIDDKINSVTNLNVLNTYWPIWFNDAINCFNIILFKNNFDAISNSVQEAAEIDGCTMLQTFFKIMLPIVAPVAFYIGIGLMSVAWADYFNPYLILKDAELYPVPTRLFLLKNDPQITPNNYLMGLMFACVPPYLIYVIFQKKIMGGMMAGAVKG